MGRQNDVCCVSARARAACENAAPKRTAPCSQRLVEPLLRLHEKRPLAVPGPPSSYHTPRMKAGERRAPIMDRGSTLSIDAVALVALEQQVTTRFGAGGGGLAIPATPIRATSSFSRKFEQPHPIAAQLDNLSTVCNLGDRSHDRRHRSAYRNDHRSAFGTICREVARTRTRTRTHNGPVFPQRDGASRRSQVAPPRRVFPRRQVFQQPPAVRQRLAACE